MGTSFGTRFLFKHSLVPDVKKGEAEKKLFIGGRSLSGVFLVSLHYFLRVNIENSGANNDSFHLTTQQGQENRAD